jgi:Exonuclease
MSSHTLVPLKVAYKKLRLLIDLGCIFVGHGLSKDFRIISEISLLLSPSRLLCVSDIFVPPDQVIDTVDLYFIKERQRRISLRFLTWYILQQDIQQETHDSIEDARSALSLYKAYQEMEEQHAFDAKLDELYRVGREHVRHSMLFRLMQAYCSHVELEASERRQGFASYSPCLPVPPFNISNLFPSDNFDSIFHGS